MIDRSLRIGMVTLAICTILSACSVKRDSTVTVITNATIIDTYTGTKILSDIFIEGERIVDIQPRAGGDVGLGYRDKDAKIIDATGLFAIPGLWDMHVHMNYLVALPSDWMSPLFIAQGVTSVRDMGGDLDNLLALRQRLNTPGVVGPKLWLGALADSSPQAFNSVGGGEFMKQFPTIPPVDTPEAAIAFVDRVADSGINFIKTYEMLRPEVFTALVKRAHYRDLPVVGHIPQRMTTREAIAAGIDGIAHLKGTDYGCARDPEALRAERVAIMDAADDSEHGAYLWTRVIGISGPKAMAQQDQSRCDELIALLARKGIWQTPGISTEAFLAKPQDELNHYTALDYMPAVTRASKLSQYRKLKKGEFSEVAEIMVSKNTWKQELIAKMHKAGINFLAGTDSPALLLPGFSLHAELDALVEAGLPPLTALQAATINPAKFFKVETSQGSIEVGKVADIVLLNADPLLNINHTRRITTVIARGRVFDRSALDALQSSYVKERP